MEKKSILAIASLIVLALVGVAIYMAVQSPEEAQPETSQQQTVQQPEQIEQQPDIIETAQSVEALTTLVTAVQAADLVETLQSEGPFTVFAPTNAAFNKLPEGTVDSLLEPANKDQLTKILTYHVVPVRALSSTLSDGQVITTVQGQELTVAIENGMVYIVDATGDRAMVTQADVETSNGIVHVIDSVLMPSQN